MNKWIQDQMTYQPTVQVNKIVKGTHLSNYKPYTTEETNLKIDTNECVNLLMTISHFIKPIKTMPIQL